MIRSLALRLAEPFRLVIPLASVLAAIALAGCDRTAEATSPLGVDSVHELQVGAHRVKVQVAVLPEELQRGLMHRPSLPADQGMLFVFPDVQRRSFWMRNTLIPLDIGYFSPDGTLRSVHAMYPHDERGVPSSTDDIQFALEMNQGWFRTHGVTPGARLSLDDLAKALEGRGFAPERLLVSRRAGP